MNNEKCGTSKEKHWWTTRSLNLYTGTLLRRKLASHYPFAICRLFKNEGTPGSYEKSQLVATALNDDIEFLSHAPTVMHASQLLFSSIVASENYFIVDSRDMIQAYSQEKITWQLKLVLRHVPVFGHSPDFLFQTIAPIRGLPYSGRRLFHSYFINHSKTLYMAPSVCDAYLMRTEKYLASALQSPSFPKCFCVFRQTTLCTHATHYSPAWEEEWKKCSIARKQNL